jgi:hypothetical protein
MRVSVKERETLRELARRYRDIAAQEVHERTMEDWRRLNALMPVRPMVLIDQIPWHEMNIDGELSLRCEDPFLQTIEWSLRTELYKWKHFPCDMVFFPFLQVPKVFSISDYGVSTHIEESDSQHMASQTHLYLDQLPDEASLEWLKVPDVVLDVASTEAREALINELVGDLLPVRMSGTTIWAAVWDRIVFWRGATTVLFDLADRPEFLHRLMNRLMEIEMILLDRLENLNLLEARQGLIHCCGAHTYELPGNDYDPEHVKARNCWVAGAAQIFSEVSPAMHDEFEIAYLKPYFERFGLVNYGCCEPLHRKIDIIRKINNVRLISISSWANVDIAAECIGREYVMARKPSPTFVAMDSLDEAAIAEETRRTLQACILNSTPCEFILKDITTVRNDPSRLTRWADVVRSTIEGF